MVGVDARPAVRMGAVLIRWTGDTNSDCMGGSSLSHSASINALGTKLAFQRYALPLIPFLAVLALYGVSGISLMARIT